MAILGTWLALVARRRTGRFAARTPAGAFRIVIAVVLALGAGELVLIRVHLRPAEWLAAEFRAVYLSQRHSFADFLSLFQVAERNTS